MVEKGELQPLVSTQVQASLDKVEIHELLARYARACDTHDWPLLKSLFTEDAYLDYTSADCPAGTRDEMVQWLEEALTRVSWAQHFICNIEVALPSEAIRRHSDSVS